MATEKPHRVTLLTTASEEVYGGQSVICRIKLDAPAPAGGMQVALSSNSKYAQVPDSVTVSQGQRSVTFIVQTRFVKKPTSVVIKATPEGGPEGATGLIIYDTSKVPVIQTDSGTYRPGGTAYFSSFWQSPPQGTDYTYNFEYTCDLIYNGSCIPIGNPKPPFTEPPKEAGNLSQVSINVPTGAQGTYLVTVQCKVYASDGTAVTGSPFSCPAAASIVVSP